MATNEPNVRLALSFETYFGLTDPPGTTVTFTVDKFDAWAAKEKELVPDADAEAVIQQRHRVKEKVNRAATSARWKAEGHPGFQIVIATPGRLWSAVPLDVAYNVRSLHMPKMVSDTIKGQQHILARIRKSVEGTELTKDQALLMELAERRLVEFAEDVIVKSQRASNDLRLIEQRLAPVKPMIAAPDVVAPPPAKRKKATAK